MSHPKPRLPNTIGARERDMLRLLDESGSLTVTEFRQALSLSNGKVNYSIGKLEDARLVEVHHPDNGGNGIPDPKEVTLTERGKRAIDWCDIDTDTLTVEERVERLERQLSEEREARKEAEERLEKYKPTEGSATAEQKADLVLRLIGVTDDSILPGILKIRAGFLGMDGYLREENVNVTERMPDGTMDAVNDLRNDVRQFTDD